MKGKIVKPPDQRFLGLAWNQVKTPVSGIFQAIADQGDIVHKGGLLGRITDINGSELSEILSPIDGVVHCMFPRRLVYPGDRLYNIIPEAKPTGWV